MSDTHQNEQFSARLTAVQAQFDRWQVDGLFITSPANRRWLSGFTGSAGQLLITREQAILSTDFRYWTQATRQSPHFTLFQHNRQPQATADLMHQAAVKRIGLEAQHTTLAELAELKEIADIADITWVPLADTLEPLRERKSTAELDAIKAAAAITDHTMSQVNHLAKPGMTERQLAWELEKVMREAGADRPAFTIIVAGGEHSALPHHHPGDYVLQAGDALIVDLGAELNGYKSDLTRTFYLGAEPDPQFWQVYNLVQAAQTAALNHIHPGLNTKQADALARDVIESAGHGEHFGHGLGHGLGLDIHELPRLSTREEMPLQAQTVCTIEPGVYIPGWGGVRIEDLIYLTPSGATVLSHCPKIPVIAGNS